MKVIVSYQKNDVLSGLASTFSAIKADCIFWQKHIKPTYDMLDETKPDIVILQDSDVDQVLINAAQEYSATKFIVVGSRFDSRFIPSLVCLTETNLGQTSEEEGYYSKILLKPAANLAKFCNGKKSKEHSSDLLYISDVQAHGTIIPSILSSILYNANYLRLRLVGDSPIPLPEYVGNTSIATLNNLIASTIIGLDLTGLHYLDYAINKIFCLSVQENDYVPHISAENYIEEIKKFYWSTGSGLKSDGGSLRKKYIKNAYSKVLDTKATYFHIVADIFNNLDMEDKAKITMNKMELILNGNG